MLPDDLLQQAAALVAQMTSREMMLVTAESCTGGLVAEVITEVPGASAVLDRGFVTYSNEAKMAVLGVSPFDLSQYGAVSAPVAIAMAEGALRFSMADVAVAITGIAGPGGATEAKPVGLVHFAVARTGSPTVQTECRFGDIGRRLVREAAVRKALDMVGEAIAS